MANTVETARMMRHLVHVYFCVSSLTQLWPLGTGTEVPVMLGGAGCSLLSFTMGLRFSCFLPGDVCTSAALHEGGTRLFRAAYTARAHQASQLSASRGCASEPGQTSYRAREVTVNKGHTFILSEEDRSRCFSVGDIGASSSCFCSWSSISFESSLAMLLLTCNCRDVHGLQKCLQPSSTLSERHSPCS